MKNNGAAFQAIEVSRHYTMGDAVVRAIDQLSLEIAHGEYVALLGASGSGKSTLLNLLAGLDRPTSGAIFANGRDISAMNGEELARHRNRTIGMVFQAFQLLPKMTLEENVELPLRLAETPRAERPARVREALDRVLLSARRTHHPSQLSGGEQQRAAIARALVNRPSILLADEPTGNLDSRTGEEILQLIEGLHRPAASSGSSETNGSGDAAGAARRMTVVLVTHEQGLAERFADRIVTISDGRIEREVRR
ncbi:MAG: ABC transporter ATP-binding protein [Candidatus Acidiferrales bacterium]